MPEASSVSRATKEPRSNGAGKPPLALPDRKRRRDAWRGSEGLSEAEKERAEPLPEKKKRRKLFRRREKMVPPDAYAADQGHLATVKWLAVVLSLAVVFSMAPALTYLNLAAAPGWARSVLLLGVLQLFFIAWVVNGPDWASVWVLMLVFAGVSTLYGMATAMALATPLDKPMLLGMGQVRDSAGRWCGAVLMVMSLATYLCGRTAARWRRSFELGVAGTAAKRPGRGF